MGKLWEPHGNRITVYQNSSGWHHRCPGLFCCRGWKEHTQCAILYTEQRAIHIAENFFTFFRFYTTFFCFLCLSCERS